MASGCREKVQEPEPPPKPTKVAEPEVEAASPAPVASAAPTESVTELVKEELKPGKGLQFDGGVIFNESDDVEDDTAFAGGLHLFHQQEASRWGGFVGLSTSDDVTTWDVGGEGQIFLNNVVLDGAVGYFNIDDVDVDGWGARTSASVFPNDNFSLTGGFGIATADGDGFDADGWTAGAGTEFQLTNQPISFSLNYSHSEIDDFDVEVDSVSVGINYNFGGGTLKDRATTGAGLRGLGLAGLFRY